MGHIKLSQVNQIKVFKSAEEVHTEEWNPEKTPRKSTLRNQPVKTQNESEQNAVPLQ